jgi:hypothetical protein
MAARDTQLADGGGAGLAATVRGGPAAIGASDDTWPHLRFAARIGPAAVARQLRLGLPRRGVVPRSST